jgi:hypothetical protein
MEEKKPCIRARLYDVVVVGNTCRLLILNAIPRHLPGVAQTKLSLDSCAFFGGAGFETARRMRFGG